MQEAAVAKQPLWSRLQDTTVAIEIALDPEKFAPVVSVNGDQLSEEKVMQSQLLLSERASRIGTVYIPLKEAYLRSWIAFDKSREKHYEPEDLATVLQVRCQRSSYTHSRRSGGISDSYSPQHKLSCRRHMFWEISIVHFAQPGSCGRSCAVQVDKGTQTRCNISLPSLGLFIRQCLGTC